MNGTAAAKIHCPNPFCQKPVLTQVALAEGSRFVLRCPNCKSFVRIIATFTTIEKRILTGVKDTAIITAEDTAEVRVSGELI